MVDRTFKRLGEGTYVCYLNRIVEGLTKSGKPRVSIAYKVCDGADAGEFVWDNVTTASDKGISILAKKLATLAPELAVSLTCENLADEKLRAALIENVKQLAGVHKYKVDVRPGKSEGFFNVYAGRL